MMNRSGPSRATTTGSRNPCWTMAPLQHSKRLRAARRLPPRFGEMRVAVTEAAAQQLQETASLAAHARRTETALLELADLLADITKPVHD